MSLPWWTYVALVAAAFAGGLLLNYAVKKFNGEWLFTRIRREARIDQRFASLRRKRSPCQATQVQGPLIEIETKTPKPLENIIAKSNATAKGISLVFNKEDNNMLESKRAKEDLIKNSSFSTPQEFLSGGAAAEKTQSERCIGNKITEKSITKLEAVSSKVISKAESKTLFPEQPLMRLQSVSNKPTFLGNIYKNAVSSSSRSNILGLEKRKEEKLVLDKPVDTVVNIKEIKSTPSIVALLEVQNDVNNWISDIVYKKIESREDLRPDKSGTSFDN